jgi:hypothetical protein
MHWSLMEWLYDPQLAECVPDSLIMPLLLPRRTRVILRVEGQLCRQALRTWSVPLEVQQLGGRSLDLPAWRAQVWPLRPGSMAETIHGTKEAQFGPRHAHDNPSALCQDGLCETCAARIFCLHLIFFRDEFKRKVEQQVRAVCFALFCWFTAERSMARRPCAQTPR